MVKFHVMYTATGQTTDWREVDFVPFTGLVHPGSLAWGRFLLHSLIREVRSPMAAGLHIFSVEFAKSDAGGAVTRTTLQAFALLLFWGGF